MTGRGELDSYVGRVFAEIEGADAITEASVRHLLEAMDWDWPGESRGVVGVGPDGVVVPLSSYLTHALPAYRSRGDALPSSVFPPLPYHLVPLEWSRRMATTVEVHAGVVPMRVGDKITSTWSVISVHRTTTRLGECGFIAYEARFCNQGGDSVALERATLVGFEPHEESGGGPAPVAIPPSIFGEPTFERGNPVVGAIFASVELDLTPLRLAMVHSANRDFAPIHHDPVAAAEIGSSSIVVNSMFLLSLVERLIMDNGGADTKVLQLGPLKLLKPTPSGQEISCRGRVVEVSRRKDALELALEVEVSGHLTGVTVTALARAEIPLPVRLDLLL